MTSEPMATITRYLVANVTDPLTGDGYGPAYGNADRVPPEVAERITNPAAWDAPTAGSPGDEGQGTVSPDGAPAPPAATLADAEAALATSVQGVADAERALIAEVTDKDDLLTLAAARGVDVSARWGVNRIRTAVLDAGA